MTSLRARLRPATGVPSSTAGWQRPSSRSSPRPRTCRWLPSNGSPSGARGEFEAIGDELGVGLCCFALAHVHHNACRWQERHEALELAYLHAERAGDADLQDQSLLWMAAGPVHGPMPTDEGLRWFDAHDGKLAGVALVAGMRGSVEAMVGNFDTARGLMSGGRERLQELGQELWVAGTGLHATAIEMLAGDYEAAAREGVVGCEALQAIGERGWLSTLAGQTAQALLELHRDDEAEHWIGVAEAVGGPDDVITQALIRQVRGKLLGRRGHQAEAEVVAREAVALIEGTDMLEARAEAKLDLAEVLQPAGKNAERVQLIEEASSLYEQKRHLVGMARTAALLEAARFPPDRQCRRWESNPHSP